MKDLYGREIDYMRISITDRCNLRCRYCMPDGISLVPMDEILTYEEIEVVAMAAVKVGIKKFKITGGEPLVRKGCPELIHRLKAIPGVEQVTLTTNGVLLKQYLEELLNAGLDAVNISLDTLNPEVFQKITGRDGLDLILAGIEATIQKDIPVKINTVLQKGMNDKEWLQMVDLAKKYPVDVRFIEMMPIGSGQEFETIFNEKLLERLKETYGEMKEDMQAHGNGPAVYYHIPGFKGSIGFISAMHGKFCDKCNRIRLTAKGQFKPCLCYGESIDIRRILRDADRSGDREKEVFDAIQTAILKKPKQHCFEEKEEITESRRMVQIGG